MEHLQLPGVSLHGFAQGGNKTSIHVDQIASTFDAGVPLPITSSRYFITHGHPDHSAAIPYIATIASIRRPEDAIQIHVPKDLKKDLAETLRAMERFAGGRRVPKWEIHPMSPGVVVDLGQGYSVKAVRTYHGVPSCGYIVLRTTRKLKQEFVGMNSRELVEVKSRGIEITQASTAPLIAIPGDTQIEFLQRCEEAQEAKVLLHEVTYWEDGDKTYDDCRERGHTHLKDMREHAHLFRGDHLVLVHRSLRYARAEVEQMIPKVFSDDVQAKIKLFDGGDRM